jgi:Tfp pilus assembly protein PilN
MKAVNLIPSDDRAGGVGGVGVGRSQGAAYGVLALLAGLAVLALVYGLARHQVSSRRSQLATVTARTQQVQSAAAALSSYASFDALREQRVKAVTELVDARFDWAHSLHELGRVMPGGTSISSLTGTIGAATGPGAAAGAAKTTSAAPASTAASATGSTSGASATAASPVTSATPPGSVPTITLGGCATSQSKVALTLQRLRLIDGVSKVSLQSSAKATRSASGSAGGSSEACAGGAAFSVTLTFQPLPTVSATGKAGPELTSSTGGQP